MTDPFDAVLRLVAEGRISAEEAGPILDALAPGGPGPAGEPVRPVGDDLTGGASGGPGRFARIEVREGGRRAVDIRVPLSLGRFGLSSIPGLSGPTIDRLRDAIERGESGPILEVADDDGDGVRIAIE